MALERDESIRIGVGKDLGNGEQGLVSVVIPCCGQLEHTRLCAKSVLKHSRRPCEVIFIDVGSLDGTADYLDGVVDAAPVRVEVIHAASEELFQVAVTEGLKSARGEYVAWLANDVIVTEGWLQQLVALASAHEKIGMVGPMANVAPSLQRVESAPYRAASRAKRDAKHGTSGREELLDVSALERFARQWRDDHKGKWFSAERLGGFCLLVKREVVKAVPWFEVNEETGTFDADRLCWRVLERGYHLACCGDLYVHHFATKLVEK